MPIKFLNTSNCRQFVIYGTLVFICLILTVLKWQIVDIPLERDEGEYAYIANRWLADGIPYRDAFDQKPPGVFFIYAMVFRTLGTSIEAIHWGLHISVILTLLVVFILGRILFTVEVGLIAALFTGVLLSDPSLLGNAANTEPFMTLFMSASLLTAVIAAKKDQWPWSLATGILAALSLLCKQVALPPVCFILVLVLLLAGSRRRWTHFLMAILGILISLIAVGCYFYAHGAGSDYYDCVFTYNLKYASDVPLSDYLSNFCLTASNIFTSIAPICLMVIMGLFAMAYSAAAKKDQRLGKSGLLVFLWFLASFCGVTIGGRYRPHYFIELTPSIALIAALGVISISSLIKSWRLSLVFKFAMPLIIISYTLLINSWYYLPGDPLAKSERLYHNNVFGESLEVGRFLQYNSLPSDRIFIFGSEPQILFHAKRISSSRYIFCYPLMLPYPGTLERQQYVLKELDDRPPRIIITAFLPPSLLATPQTPRYIFSALEKKLASDYQLVALLPNGSHWTDTLITDKTALGHWNMHQSWYRSDYRPMALAIWKRLK